MIIRSKAPLRISFAGGGTDVPPYPEEFGGCVLSSTIDKYAYTSLTQRSDKKITINSLDFNLIKVLKKISTIKYDGSLDLPKAVFKILKYKQKGLDLIISSDCPPGSGLGSSSAAVVSLVSTIKKLLNLTLSSYEIANLAVRIEREELQIPGGLQDQYATTFGGFNFIEFGKNNKVLVNPLRISKNIQNELISRIILADTGRTRFSGNILQRHVKAYKENKEGLIQALHDSKKNAFLMKDSLLRGEIDEFAKLLEEGWEQKKRRDSHITDKKIDAIYLHAKKTGAIGGKLLGAGGGGHVLLLCKFGKKYLVKKKLLNLGCNIIPFTFETEGTQSWKISDNNRVES